MRAGEGDDANARMDKLKPKAAQFQSFILIHSFFMLQSNARMIRAS